MSHALPAYIHEACDSVDAAIFTGDTLYDDAQRTELKTWIDRWACAIREHEQLNLDVDAPDTGAKL